MKQAIIGTTIPIRWQMNNADGTPVDPTGPFARLETGSGSFSDLAAPTKRDGKTGYYGVDVDTSAWTAGTIYTIRTGGTNDKGEQAVAYQFVASADRIGAIVERTDRLPDDPASETSIDNLGDSLRDTTRNAAAWAAAKSAVGNVRRGMQSVEWNAPAFTTYIDGNEVQSTQANVLQALDAPFRRGDEVILDRDGQDAPLSILLGIEIGEGATQGSGFVLELDAEFNGYGSDLKIELGGLNGYVEALSTRDLEVADGWVDESVVFLEIPVPDSVMSVMEGSQVWVRLSLVPKEGSSLSERLRLYRVSLRWFDAETAAVLADSDNKLATNTDGAVVASNMRGTDGAVTSLEGIATETNATANVEAIIAALPDAPDNATLAFLAAYFQNRLVTVTDKKIKTVTLYDSDGTTPLKVWTYDTATATREAAE